MRGKRITIDEIEEYTKEHPHREDLEKFLVDAFNAGAIVTADNYGCFGVVTKVPEMEVTRPNGSKIVGTYMVIWGKDYSHNDVINTWIATSSTNSDGDEVYSDGFSIGEFPLSDGFRSAINKSIEQSGICPFCGKRVGIQNLKHVAFADKACEDCYPAAKKRLEYPGWTN